MAEAFVLDRRVILDRLGGDQDILAMMLDMYLQDVDNNCAALDAAMAASDAKTLQREAHTIKGLLSTFSDDAGAAMAFAIEQKAKFGNTVVLTDDVAALRARLLEVAGVLQAESGVAG
ncbi:Hpt domain-containing protein [Dechloromonas sp. TW-R-39-2]|uniref:Hpt domain-containing protein n=1 Tax=Dechloromonas sp. TW-R-39-2 TaxID=2654218 RepID=UPI00193E3E2D|nr:Hpt domain-containing protein [Dechloromonas sp. TW-R-39-2]